MPAREPPPPRARLDVWLWRARLAKTRPLAAKLARSGHVRVNGVRERAPGRGLLVGDVLTIALSGRIRVLRIVDFGERRGPAEEAQALYEDLSPPQRPELAVEETMTRRRRT